MRRAGVTRQLIVFARAPLPGDAKSRLAESIGETPAAGVYARLLYGILLDLLDAEGPEVELVLSVPSPDDVPYFAAAFPEFDVRAQVRGDLGARLEAAFQEAYAAGARAVVVVASDVPDLDATLIYTAFRMLEGVPAVIGPSSDGGYYLLGMRDPGAQLFEGVDWGTDRVLEQTEALAAAAGLPMARLPERLDVDAGEDLIAWRRAIDGASEH
jgi:hypothetical protein